ncbi:hypothetical protein ASPWEDRAFT_368911 [Aspergillus wentii DTO 134E9]|uniref:Prolyl 4-hydroxylase alpha subunit domain-containing protein n=1 Tax=Aspergillus wentii DTO 134E9 TaxID=1073089 RepID=A0A1L9RWL9_ASPWE|nr:uncharacterized protein ASPWEDRAFT_368911 [Aspergillus wentii DTO 134E9]KAI9928984.1 hypothetical protein MW887_001377 [Aspergillus wentii]OJJ39329.1 hypothetical protein ASPWEDRAFT_368911 [Aspergillus wentii DTO 134E9]
MALPNLTTLLTWTFYFIPLYLFVFAPLARTFFPSLDTDLGVFDEGEDGEYEYVYDTDGLNLADDSFISPEDDVPFSCEVDGYKTHILQRQPLVIYIENFVRDDEASHLVDVSVGKYTPSIIYDGITERVDPTTRLSDRALLDRDNVVRCLEERARAFQGWQPHLYIERMWAQRYNASGHYKNHYDWAGSLARGGDRVSTFMVYLSAECEGGGTNFPRMKRPVSEKWCRFIECGSEQEGTTFRAIQGNAIFWENLRPDGRGYEETWHGANAVTAGTKVGLNIWSWYQPPRKRRIRRNDG